MPNTSEACSSELIASLHHQPLLVVLRAEQPSALTPQIDRLAALGLRHIEIAWSDHPAWIEQTRALALRSPEVCFGAASITTDRALSDVQAAGLSFAVSPVLDPALLARAQQLELTLVPGVLSPTEVHQAKVLGCSLVKLYPASAVGPGYWRSLAGPLGGLPFCIAAGGLAPAQVAQWLSSGVDAVAIGGALSGDQAWQELAQWLTSPRG
ncbi:MAG: bifunctional 4-hydroxy-2-oxoglutarate aldolase/2-dehydro-3-deoxy-phosphogluconate aldolase [Prochlorococcaceae cyanobacterium]